MTLWSRFTSFLSGWPESKHEVEEESTKPYLQGMTKKQLEEYGRTLGVELDRRHSKKKLIAKLEGL